jgi:magnesium chelatase subunit I
MKHSLEHITTVGALKSSGYRYRSVKEEIRENLIKNIQEGKNSFPGILGYEETVIPETERALLSRHNILFLGLRGQAKTRMARQMIMLLDEYIPVVAGSDTNDDPLSPQSGFAKNLLDRMGDDTPIRWMHRSERYGEKLATPDVSVADLIGDVDPIKAANLKLSFADEQVIHYGIIPRSNRGIFVINELPDLQARIQVALFNILQEGDIQIRGFKLRMPLDMLFVFTANPEDYTSRGSIVTPLKDRIESQILTHYPKTVEVSQQITEQEAAIHEHQQSVVSISDLVKKIIEQISFEARNSEYVDKKSGVSARLTISAMENAYSAAERRALLNKEKTTQIWIGDLAGIIPSITGKIELVYEGEQEGPLEVARNLMDKAMRSLFKQYFPDPEAAKKKKYQSPKRTSESPAATRKSKPEEPEDPYAGIKRWFDQGNQVDLLFDVRDNEKLQQLYRVEGLFSLVKKYYPATSDLEAALLMEFVLHGLAAHSLISKNRVESGFAFKDLIGSIMNLDMGSEEFDEDSFG